MSKMTKIPVNQINKVIQRVTDLGMLANIPSAAENFKSVLIGTHCNGCPIDFKALLGFDDFNFKHDIFGIDKNFCNKTGRLLNHFLPRSAARSES